MKIVELKKISKRGHIWLYQIFEMFFFFIISHFYRKNNKYKDIWLISERGKEAKENGYVFFKYLRENYPEINVHFVLNKKNIKDYNKVISLGPVIQYKSFKHKLAFMRSYKVISTHIGFFSPWSYKLYKYLLDRKSNKKFIFLKHGVTKDDMSGRFGKKIFPVDLLITVTKNEYESIVNNPNYGYKDEVVLTGFARYDLLNDFKTKDQILFMPTWRFDVLDSAYFKNGLIDDENFRKMDYFKRINGVLANRRLHNLLDRYNHTMIFCPHFYIQPYLKNFNDGSKSIKIASMDEYDVQPLLKESKLLITDYSSVFFDFAYMKKPVIYYQFDESHYKRSYFSYKNDGFGEITDNEETLVDLIEKCFKNSFKMDPVYVKRVENCFKYRDNNNCKRIYEEIIKI